MQVLKEDIKKSIDTAALELFSEKGYANTTMADIASRAGISTGNLYRYYPGKEVLFYSLINDRFVDSFMNLMDSKMRTADGIALKEALYYGPMNIKDRELLNYLAEYRLHLVILLDRSEATRYASFREQMLDNMVVNALRYRSAHYPSESQLPAVKLPLLRIIYENLLRVITRILGCYTTPDEIKEAYLSYLQYHYQGIDRFLGH